MRFVLAYGILPRQPAVDWVRRDHAALARPTHHRDAFLDHHLRVGLAEQKQIRPELGISWLTGITCLDRAHRLQVAQDGLDRPCGSESRSCHPC